MDTYKIKPDTIEKIEAVRKSSKWKSSIKMVIEEEAEAKRREEEDEGDVQVYTDGSGIEGKIGAAAVLFRDETPRGAMRFQLGADTANTVYEGEAVGALMGLKLIEQEDNVRVASMFIDNQAAITATSLIKPAPGHYIMDALHDELRLTRRKYRNLKLTVLWIPSHIGIEGNEMADAQAKKAAAGQNSRREKLPTLIQNPLPRSKSAVKQRCYAKLKVAATKILTNSPQFQRMKRTTSDKAPSQKYCELLKKLPRKHGSILTQLRIGHIPLAAYLHHISKADSPMCPCCHQEPETIAHYLLQCPAHQNARNRLRTAIAPKQLAVDILISQPTTLPELFTFITSSGRFRSVFGDLTLEPWGKDDLEGL